MRKVYVHEQKRYTQHELRDKFAVDDAHIVSILKRLKEYDILKNVKLCSEELQLSELSETSIQVTEIFEKDVDYYYVFTFVGIIIVGDIIIYSEPKYISSESYDKMKQIIRVIKKYNSREQVIKFFDSDSPSTTVNRLPLLLFLIQDYHENGIYSKSIEKIEGNGNGEIWWDKTINDTFAFLTVQGPIYTELQTRKRVKTENDYISKLHMMIITHAFTEIKEMGISELFDIDDINISDKSREEFGDNDYILYRISQELNSQYNTQKIRTLKAMYSFISDINNLSDISCISLYGTNCFNLVWENACAEVFSDFRNTKICDLPNYDSNRLRDGQSTLLSYIGAPVWKSDKFVEGIKKDTLIPDIITIYKHKYSHCFAILDAKYYLIKIDSGGVSGNPGVGDVTKQHLYELAYQELYMQFEYTFIQNAFLFPSDDENPEFLGSVSIEFLKNASGLSEIQALKMPAKVIFDMYLDITDRKNAIKMISQFM